MKQLVDYEKTFKDTEADSFYIGKSYDHSIKRFITESRAGLDTKPPW